MLGINFNRKLNRALHHFTKDFIHNLDADIIYKNISHLNRINKDGKRPTVKMSECEPFRNVTGNITTVSQPWAVEEGRVWKLQGSLCWHPASSCVWKLPLDCLRVISLPRTVKHRCCAEKPAHRTSVCTKCFIGLKWAITILFSI